MNLHEILIFLFHCNNLGGFVIKDQVKQYFLRSSASFLVSIVSQSGKCGIVTVILNHDLFTDIFVKASSYTSEPLSESMIKPLTQI